MTKQNNSKPQHNSPMGNRNPVFVAARAKVSAGYMRAKQGRRAKDAKKSWKNEQW